ncbi:MAG: lactate utilization protein [Treponema sp.]|nr:lactate utilization protein [Treponema sp.]
MKTPMELRYDKLGPKVAKALASRFFEAWYFSEEREAEEKVFSLIPKTDTISWGGSLTVAGLNLTKLAVEKGYKVIDRDTATDPAERNELMRQALLCDTFLTGTNAITEDGQLFNIDGFGNRVAAMIFGPKQVIIVVGMNKVVKTLEDAYSRIRNIAAPANMQRFSPKKTPCIESGACADCLSEDSICSFITRIRLCKPAGRIKVILIGKDLGL